MHALEGAHKADVFFVASRPLFVVYTYGRDHEFDHE